jgi:EmrB/QacA subfamily drug resistance transporter
MEVQGASFIQHSLPRRQVVITMGGTVLTMFIGALYMTVVSTAMPRIITDLGGFSQYTWVFSSYIIAQTITVPISGKLSDMYGRKWFFVGGVLVFTIGTLLCGLSQTIDQLIIFRGLQGLGFGVMQALGFIVIGDLFPPSERGKWVGLTAAVFGLATIIGPTIGGYLTDYLSWRWAFFVNIPLGVIVILLFIFLFPQLRRQKERHKVDYAGAVTMTLALVPLMLGLTWGGVEYAWLSPQIIGLFAFTALMIALFFFFESRAEEAIIPLWIFRRGAVVIAALSALATGFCFFPAVSFVPLYFQGVLGATAALSGGFLTPMMLASAFGSFLSGQGVSRFGGHYRLQGLVGFAAVALGLLLLSSMEVGGTYLHAIIYIVIVGFGAGIVIPLYTLTVQNTLPHAVLGTATSMITWLRTIGAVFGLSIVGSVMNNRFHREFAGNLTDEVRAVVSPEKLAAAVDNPQALINPAAQEQLKAFFDGLGEQGAVLFQQMYDALLGALNSALTEVFAVLGGMAVVAVLVNFWLRVPQHRRETPGEEENAG